MSNNGMFNAEEWKFECKLDDAAQKQLETIQKIRDDWNGWYEKRRMYGDTSFVTNYNKELKVFADKECKSDIAKLERKV